jgi:hypothetical protein
MPRKDSSGALLREGYKSYNKALFAVMGFRRQIGDTVRQAVEARLPQLASALKLDEDELRDGLIDYTSPDRLTQQNFDGSRAEIGVRMPRDWNSQWHLFFYLVLEDGESAWFGATVRLKRPGSAIEKLVAAGRDVEADNTSASISEQIPANRPQDLAAVCDRVLNRWAALSKKAGGLSQFLRRGKA